MPENITPEFNNTSHRSGMASLQALHFALSNCVLDMAEGSSLVIVSDKGEIKQSEGSHSILTRPGLKLSGPLSKEIQNHARNAIEGLNERIESDCEITMDELKTIRGVSRRLISHVQVLTVMIGENGELGILE